MPDCPHWRVHLLRREPHRLSAFLSVLVVGAGCVWMMFGTFLPLLAAVAVLTLAAAEYLFPIQFLINEDGIKSRTLTGRFELKWADLRRVHVASRSIYVSPLARASRLEAFRGFRLLFADAGEPGDRESVLAALHLGAPGATFIDVPLQDTAIVPTNEASH